MYVGVVLHRLGVLAFFVLKRSGSQTLGRTPISKNWSSTPPLRLCKKVALCVRSLGDKGLFKAKCKKLINKPFHSVLNYFVKLLRSTKENAVYSRGFFPWD